MIQQKLIEKFGGVINHMSCIYLRDGEKHLRSFFEDKKPLDTIIEIGPGQGALTQHIIAVKPSQYYAIEIDTILAEELAIQFKDNINVIQQDFLEFDFTSNPGTNNSRIKIIGNN